MIYAGIGSRKTPVGVLALMEKFARWMATEGHILRSGAAKGADQAFMRGHAEIGAPAEIAIPWLSYEEQSWKPYGSFYTGSLVSSARSNRFMDLAKRYHPAWDKCSPDAKKLHARNGAIILGFDMDSPVDLVVCWTEDGKGEGGTGQALRVARNRNIPVIDLGAYKIANMRSVLYDTVRGITGSGK